MFSEVEEGMEFTLEFQGGVTAKCYTSFVDNHDFLKVETERGWFRLEPAFAYSGLKGETSEGRMDISPVNQQVAQMDAFSSSIMNGTPNKATGEEGLQDVKIIKAIFEAAETGKRIEIK